MTAHSRGSRAATCLLRTLRDPFVCKECLNHNRKSYSIAATSFKTSDASPDSKLNHISVPPVSATVAPYRIQAGVVLTRPPLLTAPLTSFEKAFFFYQKRLNERLVMPFSRYFYFKKGSPADIDYKIKAKERNRAPARELGGYTGYGDEAWNDELLVTNSKDMGLAEPKHLIESLVKDAKVRAVEGKDGVAVEVDESSEVEGDITLQKPLSRITEADKSNDTKRLDRQLARTLYLLVQRENGGWGFPSGDLIGKENLHEAAERVLVQAGGPNMNTWLVGHAPIGNHVIDPRVSKDPKQAGIEGVRTFFMKGRIMAGRANLAKNTFGLKDFKWLTKEEVKKHVASRYYSHIRDFMADR